MVIDADVITESHDRGHDSGLISSAVNSHLIDLLVEEESNQFGEKEKRIRVLERMVVEAVVGDVGQVLLGGVRDPEAIKSQRDQTIMEPSGEVRAEVEALQDVTGEYQRVFVAVEHPGPGSSGDGMAHHLQVSEMKLDAEVICAPSMGVAILPLHQQFFEECAV